MGIIWYNIRKIYMKTIINGDIYTQDFLFNTTQSSNCLWITGSKRIQWSKNSKSLCKFIQIRFNICLESYYPHNQKLCKYIIQIHRLFTSGKHNRSIFRRNTRAFFQSTIETGPPALSSLGLIKILYLNPNWVSSMFDWVNKN